MNHNIQDWFNSKYYRLLYSYRDEKEASMFLENLLKYLNPLPHSSIVDLGCGRGRFSLLLGEKNFYVTGLDYSENNIRYLKKKEKENMKFFLHDIRQPWGSNQFDYAFSFFTSFGFWQDDLSYINTLKNIFLSLRPKGRFVFDYLNKEKYDNNKPLYEEKNTQNVFFKIKKFQDDTFFYKQIDIVDFQSNKTLQYLEKVKKISKNELEKMFRKVGFQVNDIFGNYHLSPFFPTKSERLILIAEKKSN